MQGCSEGCRGALRNAGVDAESQSSGGALNGSAAAAGRFTAAGTAALGALMALLIAVIVAGNALVMLAFVADSSLRTQNNFFLLNLAISDFLVGAFCIPLYVPYVLTGRWIFGRRLCKLWLVVDYLLCTSSVFNIVLISYDRFLSVTRAVAYRAQQGNTKQAVLKMVMVWVLAFLLYGPAIITPEGTAQSEPEGTTGTQELSNTSTEPKPLGLNYSSPACRPDFLLVNGRFFPCTFAITHMG
uniref:Uncharacterized protein n=1 Tax=Melopsittacus undulatus TaxID=13146 RepID=A0A8V5G939_MELUD